MAYEYDYQPSETDDEYLAVVNEDDEEIGKATRAEIHDRKLFHRAIHVVISDGKGNILLQKRSRQKDSHPGWWDVSVGGHVDFGESYEEAVRRELKEELGITTPFWEVARRQPIAETGWEFIRIYAARYHGAFQFNTSEIESIAWKPLKEVLELPNNPSGMTLAGQTSVRLWLENETQRTTRTP